MCYTAPLFLMFSVYTFIPIGTVIYLQRILISIISRQNFGINVLLHPLQMIMLLLLGIYSLILSKKHKRVWKGRIF
jgi:hypothetical protein